MTTDPIAAARALIEPLREHREQQTVAGGSWWEAPEICTQAADAIATLIDAVEAGRAENQRLRATLSAITATDCYSRDECTAMARAALSSTEDET